jgi:hypothetical protein
MKLKGYKFSAEFDYKFSPPDIFSCRHCGQVQRVHAEGKCLFEPTFYSTHDLLKFFELLGEEGGSITLRAGNFSLTQGVSRRAVDVRPHNVKGHIRTFGEAYLTSDENGSDAPNS